MKQIMIVVNTSRASGRKFLVGVERYLSSSADWEVHIQPPDYVQKDSRQVDLQCTLAELDGLLIRDATNTAELIKLKVPKVINDTQRERIPKTSTIMTDSPHLGFENFAFCGFQELAWSQKRHMAFMEVLADRKIGRVSHFENRSHRNRKAASERMRISRWIEGLPRPVCIFACNDDRAVSVLEACKTAGVSVPQEVAVLGVDNDELICNLSSPPLSSIELDFERAGFSAAQHLDDLIHRKAERKIIQVSPLEIVERQSTDILAIDDSEMVSALVYIRRNYLKPIQSTDVVNATSLSRRELERRFRRYLNKTIKNEIDRLRIELAKKKLLNSRQTVGQVALSIEFTDPEHFSRYFKKATGQSPTQFRGNC
jgi:LacI family transcriptional regulator